MVHVEGHFLYLSLFLKSETSFIIIFYKVDPLFYKDKYFFMWPSTFIDKMRIFKFIKILGGKKWF